MVDQQCIDFIKGWEGFRRYWYRDAGGVWTIGYGTTEHGGRVEKGETEVPLSKSRATSVLRETIESDFVPPVDGSTPDLAAHKRWALYSFAYNVGVSAFKNSTLREKLALGREEEAEEEFLRWVHVNGEVVEGLVHRRRAERDLFERDEPPDDVLGDVGPEITSINVAEPVNIPVEQIEDQSFDLV